MLTQNTHTHMHTHANLLTKILRVLLSPLSHMCILTFPLQLHVTVGGVFSLLATQCCFLLFYNHYDYVVTTMYWFHKSTFPTWEVSPNATYHGQHYLAIPDSQGIHYIFFIILFLHFLSWLGEILSHQIRYSSKHAKQLSPATHIA